MGLAPLAWNHEPMCVEYHIERHCWILFRGNNNQELLNPDQWVCNKYLFKEWYRIKVLYNSIIGGNCGPEFHGNDKSLDDAKTEPFYLKIYQKIINTIKIYISPSRNEYYVYQMMGYRHMGYTVISK